jgi:hypothetical protein
MTTAAPKPLKIFCSYAHEDEVYLEVLHKQLRQLERLEMIEWWHDREITPGDKWREAIDEKLQGADVILILVSPDLIASDFAYEEEMKRAIERHERDEALVIPIIIRYTDFEDAPFKSIQSLPTDLKPVVAWSDQDEAWLNVVTGIRKAIGKLSAERQQPAMEEVRKTLEQVRTAGKRGKSGGETLPNPNRYHGAGGFGGQSSEILAVVGPKLAAKERALSHLRQKIAAGEELSQTEMLQYEDLIQQQNELFMFAQNLFTSDHDKIKQWGQSLGRI